MAQTNHIFHLDRFIYRGMELHFVFDSLECIHKLKKNHYDALVVQMGFDQRCVSEILKTASEENVSVFCIFEQMNNEMMELLFSYQVKYYFLGPVSFQEICNKLCEMKGQKEKFNLSKKSAELLHTLGIPNSVQGYSYILDSIISCYYQEEYLKGITKRLYPMLASEHKTTPCAVEKSIRHAIEMAFSRSDQTFLYDFFKGTIRSDKAKATNSQFISMCVEYIRTEGL